MLKIFSAFIILFFSFPVLANDIKHNLYSYPTAKGMKVGAVFGLLPNIKSDDILVSASSPICEHVEIHTMLEENGIFKMRKIENLPVKADKENQLSPSGYHLMLMNLEAPLEVKQSFPLTLTFQKSGDKTVTIPVISRNKK